MRLYQRFADRLRKELEAEPEDDTKELYDEMRG